MEAKRDLFEELVEGFDARKDQREGQRTLRTAPVEATNATLKRLQRVAATAQQSEHQPDSTLDAKQTG